MKKKELLLFATAQTVDKTTPGNQRFLELFFFILVFSDQEWIIALIYAICNPHSFLIFASFFKFIHAKVSATFISIRAFPYICVYLKP